MQRAKLHVVLSSVALRSCWDPKNALATVDFSRRWVNRGRQQPPGSTTIDERHMSKTLSSVHCREKFPEGLHSATRSETLPVYAQSISFHSGAGMPKSEVQNSCGRCDSARGCIWQPRCCLKTTSEQDFNAGSVLSATLVLSSTKHTRFNTLRARVGILLPATPAGDWPYLQVASLTTCASNSIHERAETFMH